MGKSYPRARFDALSEYGVPQNMLLAIAQPNNILAVEYLGAIKKFAAGIDPLPIERIGTGYHSEEIAGEFASATAIRRAIRRAETRFSPRCRALSEGLFSTTTSSLFRRKHSAT
jgi:predicted nucleotidyltransferase